MNWWERAVIYEIYPRSFSDSNGDGVGDLNGITSRLDYLHSLGIDAIWLTPFYPSPQVDFGYDVSDYCAVDPQYGSLEDFDRLVMESERRGIRVIVDLVFNHTSDQHPWFVESRSSRTNPKADWYVWRDKPNNWQSLFGHSAWQYVPERGQFYYHKFYREQPDLNWRNREVRNAIYDVVRFWMKRGVAGFRLDAITSLFEDAGFRDERVLPGLDSYGEPKLSREYTENLPELHEVLRELRQVVEERPGTVLLGETYLPNIQELAKMYGSNNDEVHLPMDMRFGFRTKFTAEDFRERLREAETELHGNVPLLVLDNHDNPRSATRFGEQAGKLLATLLLAARGAALIYYGQEIGMKNHGPERREDVRDPMGRIGWPNEKGRDGERTPMQWSSAPNAGFSSAATTWLPVAPDYKTCNVEAQERDPDSLLNYYRSLIRMRKENPALRDGNFTLVSEDDPNVLSWIRKAGGKAVLAAVNFSAIPRTAEFEGMRFVLPGYGAYIGELTDP